MPNLLQTTREELIDRFLEADPQGKQFSYRTLPYYATTWFKARVVNDDATGNFAYAVFDAQPQDVFDYGIGSRILAGAVERKATASDTNLIKANSTNGAYDMVIEEITVHAKHPLFVYDGITSGNDLSFVADGDTIDADVLKALQGEGDIFDPTAIAVPQQARSPFFADATFWKGLVNAAHLAVTFDGSNYRNLGLLANFALGHEGHPPYNDAPAPSDLCTEIPEGLLWSKDGESDSDFQVRITLPRPVVVPINGVVAPGGVTVRIPSEIYLPVVVTLRGLEMGKPSVNA